MDIDSMAQAAKAANQLGLVGLLAAIIITGIKAMWVPGFAYREKKAERDQAVEALDRFVKIHEDQTRALEEQAHNVGALSREVMELRVALGGAARERDRDRRDRV